jgi:hypothetical protein
LLDTSRHPVTGTPYSQSSLCPSGVMLMGRLWKGGGGSAEMFLREMALLFLEGHSFILLLLLFSLSLSQGRTGPGRNRNRVGDNTACRAPSGVIRVSLEQNLMRGVYLFLIVLLLVHCSTVQAGTLPPPLLRCPGLGKGECVMHSDSCFTHPKNL